MTKKQKIYFDYAATTPIDPEVLKAMMPYLKEKYGNASSLHSFGQEAMAGVDWARKKVADFLGCQPKEIIFTSGATESDNLAVRGVLAALRKKFNKLEKELHIITSSIEHPAILETCQYMEKVGYQVSYLPITPKGLVKIESVEKAVRPETGLISIMYVNNEIGTIQPIAEIGKLLKKINQERLKNNLPRIYFHTDAVQAVNYCDCNVNYLGVDLLSISGHKIYGPKGIGALYIRKGTPIKPIQYGGQHERGIRSGTLNTTGIVGLGKAIELVKKEQKTENNKEIVKLRDKLVKEIVKTTPKVCLNGDVVNRVPANIHFSFQGIEGESLMLMLDLEGISVSTGSACASGKLEPSHVLTAMGKEAEIAHGSIRITLGKYTSEKDIDNFLKLLPKMVKKLRQMSPFK